MLKYLCQSNTDKQTRQEVTAVSEGKRAGCSLLFRKTKERGTAVALSTRPHAGRKMAAVWLLLFGFGALFLSSGAQEAYNRLPDAYRKGVDLALEKLQSHAGIQHHFGFLRSLHQSDIVPGFDVMYIYHHFYLRATTCPKGTADSTGCQFRSDRPLIDCSVCYKTYAGQIEPEPKPYIHCVHKTALTEEMKEARLQYCNNLGYSSGAPTLLASRVKK